MLSRARTSRKSTCSNAVYGCSCRPRTHLIAQQTRLRVHVHSPAPPVGGRPARSSSLWMILQPSWSLPALPSDLDFRAMLPCAPTANSNGGVKIWQRTGEEQDCTETAMNGETIPSPLLCSSSLPSLSPYSLPSLSPTSCPLFLSIACMYDPGSAHRFDGQTLTELTIKGAEKQSLNY